MIELCRLMSSLNRNSLRFTAISTLARLLAVVSLAGCTGSSSNGPQAPSLGVSKATSGDALFEDVARTINVLDTHVSLKLQPLKLVLDTLESRNKKPVLAVVLRHPDDPTGGARVLEVVSRNGQFTRQSVGVRPGDIVRYYSIVDEYGKRSYVELTVGEVIDDDHLLLAQPVEPQSISPRPESIEIWRYSGENIRAIFDAIDRYRSAEQAAVGWEPSPDVSVLQQIESRLNQWLRSRKLEDDWKPDPLVETLPDDLRSLADPEQLGAKVFAKGEGRLVQEAVWLRDIANWAGGQSLDEDDKDNEYNDDVTLATSLFDWTVRNIQLETRKSLHGVHYRPWQTLLYGRGTAWERARVFVLLARQQGLDIVVLALPAAGDGPEPATGDAKGSGGLRPWTTALVSEGKLYLFDPQLGLPIAGAGSEPVATLAEVTADPSLLRKLDLEDEPYPMQADDLKSVVALVEGSPLALSRRAMLLEQRLAGESKIVLTARPSQVAETLRQMPGVSQVRLWDFPFRTLRAQLSMNSKARDAAVQDLQAYALQPHLWKARVMHFQGKFDPAFTRRLYGEETAKLYGDDFAKLHYRNARPSDTLIASIERPFERQIAATAKIHASYFLGLLTFDAGEYRVAADYFDTRTLKAAPDGPWTGGARYNLARCYEALGKTDEAVALYEADTSPQRHGNRLRARRLKAAPADEAAPAK